MSSKEKLELQVPSCSIRNEDNVKLLEIHINNNLTFDYHIHQLCKKASKKLYALARIAKYMEINKQRMLKKLLHIHNFLNALGMLRSRKMEHRINNIHKRALKLVYQDLNDLTFEELLTKDKSVNV